ncbi:hypothetical protein PRIPAC_96227 [Pristionchus pacificus]|uniref:Ras modification protein ERF4 n=1 Tax=Pristionchus pacificus TaxID=54126 RepID=A0A2A6BJW7_PRIPA|nr:hypothetical protein PRIPAC_96227 [Pristionchus pacificus]|eukprot:PDM66128.1 hypothetical protein PRIPAC_45353 [Pristionchus pacificus]
MSLNGVKLISDQLTAEELWLHIANGSSFGGMARFEDDEHAQEEMQFDDNINADYVGNGITLQTAISERKDLLADPDDGNSADCFTSCKGHADLVMQWKAPYSASIMEQGQQDLRQPVIGKVKGQKVCTRSDTSDGATTSGFKSANTKGVEKPNTQEVKKCFESAMDYVEGWELWLTHHLVNVVQSGDHSKRVENATHRKQTTPTNGRGLIITMAEVAPISPNSPLPIQDRKCFFIQRDYSKGVTVAWSTEFPTELVRVIDERSWVSFIKELNERFAIADKITFRSVMETFLGLCTCYIFHPCTRSSYEIHLEDISDYIDDVNEQIFNSRGINVCNPMEHGMRAIEVSFLFTQKEKPSHQPATLNNLGIIPRI